MRFVLRCGLSILAVLGAWALARARRRSPDLAATADRRSPPGLEDLRSGRVRGRETVGRPETHLSIQRAVKPRSGSDLPDGWHPSDGSRRAQLGCSQFIGRAKSNDRPHLDIDRITTARTAGVIHRLARSQHNKSKNGRTFHVVESPRKKPCCAARRSYPRWSLLLSLERRVHYPR